MKSLVRNTTSAKQDLLKAYSEICALSPRYDRLVLQVEETKKRELAREFSTLNSTFAKLLDFVEDRSAEESEEDREGRRDQRMMKRFEESEPGWDEGKRLRELKKVKEEAKELSFNKLDVSLFDSFCSPSPKLTETSQVGHDLDGEMVGRQSIPRTGPNRHIRNRFQREAKDPTRLWRYRCTLSNSERRSLGFRVVLQQYSR